MSSDQDLELKIQDLSSSVQQLENQLQDAKTKLDYYNYECKMKDMELSELDSIINRKKSFIQKLDNSEGYIRIKEVGKKEVKSLMQNHGVLLTLLVSIVLESIKRYPASYQLIYELVNGPSIPNQSMLELHKTQVVELSKYIHSEILERITRLITDDREYTIAG